MRAVLPGGGAGATLRRDSGARRAPRQQRPEESVMSSTPYVPIGRGADEFAYDYDDEHGQGLVTFAGVMLMIVAVLNTLYGIAAIDNAHFFTQNAKYVFGDLNTW